MISKMQGKMQKKQQKGKPTIVGKLRRMCRSVAKALKQLSCCVSRNDTDDDFPSKSLHQFHHLPLCPQHYPFWPQCLAPFPYPPQLISSISLSSALFPSLSSLYPLNHSTFLLPLPYLLHPLMIPSHSLCPFLPFLSTSLHTLPPLLFPFLHYSPLLLNQSSHPLWILPTSPHSPPLSLLCPSRSHLFMSPHLTLYPPFYSLLSNHFLSSLIPLCLSLPLWSHKWLQGGRGGGGGGCSFLTIVLHSV